ncbi:hypothetical protein RCL1_002789 [Eukaryota sp. TZLM3-RCL]
MGASSSACCVSSAPSIPFGDNSPWKGAILNPTLSVLSSHKESVTCCIVSDCGSYFASAGSDGQVLVSNRNNPHFSLSHISSVSWPHSTPCPEEYDPNDISHFGVFDISILAMSRPNSPSPVLLSGSTHNAVRSWDLKTGKIINLYTNFQGTVTSLQFSFEDPNVFLFTNDPGSDTFPSIVAVCSVRGKDIRRRNFGLSGLRACWTRNNNKVIVAGHEGGVPRMYLWDPFKNTFTKHDVSLKVPVSSVELALLGDGQAFACRWEVENLDASYNLPSWESFYIYSVNNCALLKTVSVCSNSSFIDSSFPYQFVSSRLNSSFGLGVFTSVGPVSLFLGENPNDNSSLVEFNLSEVAVLSSCTLLAMSLPHRICIISNDSQVEVRSLSSELSLLYCLKHQSNVKCVTACISDSTANVMLGYSDGSVKVLSVS